MGFAILDIMTLINLNQKAADEKAALRKAEGKTNVALFTTSDIFDLIEPDHLRYMRLRDNVKEPSSNYGLKAETTSDSGKITHFFTKGTLERALTEGYTVWVVSTRENLGPTDSWWTKLVPGSQTLLRGPDLASRWRDRILEHFKERLDSDAQEDLIQCFDFDPGVGYTLPYIIWAITAGLKWPIHDNSPVFWTNGLAHFENEELIVRGHSFRDHYAEKVIVDECKRIIIERRTPEEQAEVDARIAKTEEYFDSPKGHQEIEELTPQIDLDSIYPYSGDCVIRRGSCIHCGCASGEGECSSPEEQTEREVNNEIAEMAVEHEIERSVAGELMVEDGRNIRNGACIVCSCAAGECEC